MRPIDRVFEITKCESQRELANLLGLQQPSISAVVNSKTGEVPAHWLIPLMRIKNIHPEWILSGQGPTHILSGKSTAQRSPERTFAEAFQAVIQDIPRLLKLIPTAILSKELTRRSTLAEKILLEYADGKKTANGNAYVAELRERSAARLRTRSDRRRSKKP